MEVKIISFFFFKFLELDSTYLGHREETTSGPVDVVEPTLEGYDDIEPRNAIGLFRKVLKQKIVHTTPTQREFLQWEYMRSLKDKQLRRPLNMVVESNLALT